MKTRFLLLLLIAFQACSDNKSDRILREVPFNGGKLYEIHLELINPEVVDVKLSELIEGFQVIPLETNEKCLIQNTKIHFSENFIFAGTQNFPQTAMLYRFDKNGNFIDEFGKAGRGPGENEGNMVDYINYCEKSKTLRARWFSRADKPQLFDNAGNLLFEINPPYTLNFNIHRLSDTIWFSTGHMAGIPRQQEDSIALVFYNRNGEILSQRKRNSFPPARGYSFGGFSKSLYKFDNSWKLYMPGNDTVFSLVDMNMIPYAVLIPDKNAIPFNQSILPEEMVGKYDLKILSETSNNWFIGKNVYTEVNVREFNGNWGGSFNSEEQLVIVDKRSGKAILAKLTDDVFNMLPDEAIPQVLKWDNNLLYFALPPYMIGELTSGINMEELVFPRSREAIEMINKIPVENNPVIFTFSLKDTFDFMPISLQSIGKKKTSEIFGETFPQYAIINPEGIVTYCSTGG